MVSSSSGKNNERMNSYIYNRGKIETESIHHLGPSYPYTLNLRPPPSLTPLELQSWWSRLSRSITLVT